MTIKNMNDLSGIIDKCIETAINLTKDTVYRLVRLKVAEYYDESVFDGENEPSSYERTLKLLNSLEATTIYRKDSISFTVGWNDDYLSYSYKGWDTQCGRGLYGENHATGETVLKYMLEGKHGGEVFKSGHNFWEGVFDELNAKYGGIENLFKANLIRAGVPIKT